jgi:hypothetical protein
VASFKSFEFTKYCYEWERRDAYDILVQKTEVCSVLHADGSIIHMNINLERGPYEQTIGLHFHIREKRLPADINFQIFSNTYMGVS